MLRDHGERPRRRCPYYGMSWITEPVMVASSGNQCALITGSYSPCQMEVARRVPDLDKCPLARQSIIPASSILQTIVVHPSVKQVSLLQWMNETVGSTAGTESRQGK